MLRSVRWLDRCIAVHKASGRDKPSEQEAEDEATASIHYLSPTEATTGPSKKEKKPPRLAQSLFAIIQGGLDPALRIECLEEMIKRKDDVPGYAIGGLSGGEEKGLFLLLHPRN